MLIKLKFSTEEHITNVTGSFFGAKCDSDCRPDWLDMELQMFKIWSKFAVSRPRLASPVAIKHYFA